MKKKLRPRTRWLLALVAVASLCLLAEAVVRVRLYLNYGTFARAHSFAIDEATGMRIPPPGRDTGKIKIDSRGFRNDELAVPKPARRIRLAFLGASTTFCAEVSHNDATWAALVCAELRRLHPRHEFDYVNAGVAGYVLADIQKNLELRVKPLQPDVIVVYEATNDLTKDSRASAIEQGVYVEHADREGGLSDVSLLVHLIEKNWLSRRRSEAARHAEGRLDFDADVAALGFESRLRTLIDSARATAPVVALATFSQRARVGQSDDAARTALVTHVYYMPYMSHATLIEGFAAYNRAIRRVAAASGAILIEGEDEIPADAEHFTDSVHFSDAGCKAMARRVVPALESSSAFVELLRSRD